MSNKRACPDQDPDYENIVSNDQKRLKVIEKDNKEATVRKIENIITSEFSREKQLKEIELDNIEQRLYQAQTMLDQLRACIVVSYYTANEQEGGSGMTSSTNHFSVHPAVARLVERMGRMSFESSCVVPKSVSTSPAAATATPSISESPDIKNLAIQKPISFVSTAPLRNVESCEEAGGARGARFKTKKRVIVGNVSKYIPVDRREEKDQSTHKWMVYVRGPKEEPRIDHFVKKVWFFLHPSYRPNDLVEITRPPFHLTRRGWGEFPVRVQLHFHDPRNKRVDVLHTLKLDKTYTGLQTLGAETIVDVIVYKQDVSIGVAETVGDNDAVREPIETEPVVRDVTVKTEASEGTTSEIAVRIKTEPLDMYESCETNCADSNTDVKREILFGDEDRLADRILPDRNESLPGNASVVKASIIENDSIISDVVNAVAPTKQTNAGNFQIVVVSNKSQLGDSSACSSNTAETKVVLSPLSNVDVLEGNSSIVATPEGSSNLTRAATAKLLADPAKHAAVRPTANGVNTFVKCADKHGNLYLIPLSIFLKLDPASQASIIQGATAAQATGTNSIKVKSVNAQNAMCPTHTAVVTVPFQPTVRNPTASQAKLPTSPTFAPRIVSTFSLARPPATVTTASQLRPHNSVSLLSGVSRLKAPLPPPFPIGVVTSSSFKMNDGLSSRNNQIISKDRNSRVSIPEISLNLDFFDSMELIMKHILRCYPLVQSKPDRVTLPFCAPSVEVFLSWNVGKKCAAEVSHRFTNEWQRARSIRSKLLQLCSECNKWRESDIWSVKRTLLWCRRRGYSPLKPINQNDGEENPSSVAEQFSTYTEATDLLVKLSDSESRCGHNDDEEEVEVDVVTFDELLPKKTPSTSSGKLRQRSLFSLPPTPCVEFVRDTLEQIGVKANHEEEVVEGVIAPLAEEAILSATKSFMEDIMRTSLEIAFERNGGKKCPSSLTVSDVVRGVSRLPHCDFLTDRYMGTKLENYHLMEYDNIKL